LCKDRWQGDKLIQDGCGTKNDPCARYCRKCDNLLIDPNKKLTNAHYQNGDFQDVHSFNVRMTSNGEGLLFEYGIYRDGKPYTAREVFWPNKFKLNSKKFRPFNMREVFPYCVTARIFSKSNPASFNAWKLRGVIPHVKDPKAKSLILKQRSALGVLQYKNLFSAPKQITHRIGSKNRDTIHRKIFE
jgi:ribosomal protein L40E